MSGPTSYRLSQETYELLRQNRDFYQSLFDQQKSKSTPLLPKATDAESITDAKIRDNGDIEISVILPLDDDEKPENGRLYVQDTFVFDPSETILKDYKRSYRNNEKGGEDWKGWLGKYEALTQAEKLPITDPKVQKFALRVARSAAHAIVDNDANTLPDIRVAFKKEGRLLTTTNQQILDLDRGLELKIKDKLNYYNVVRRDGKLEITLQLSADDDADATNGRIQLRDKFILDAETLEFQRLDRRWMLAPDAASDARYTAALKALQAKPDPSAEEAGAFIKNLLPALLPKGEPDYNAALALMAPGKKLPDGYRSPFAKGHGQDPAALKAAAEFSLQAMYVLSQEQVMKRYDESQGWAHFGGKVDQVKEKAALDNLFQKAKAAAEKNPGVDPFALLQNLDLTEEEKVFRDRLAGDKLMAELNELSREPDAAFRGQSLSLMARDRLLLDGGLPQSAAFLAEELKKDPATAKAGNDIMAIVEGKGSFGQKVGYVLPLFCKEVSKPSMLVGFAAAPFLGTAFELGGLRLAKYAYDAKKISDLGRGARFGAAVLGMTGEAIGFTTLHRGFERLGHSGETAWKGMGGEILSSVMLFGGMRLTHGGAGWATARMAEGKLGSRFGYRFAESEFSGAVGRTPTGRMLFGEFAPAAGKGIPTLTTTGKVASGLMNHLGGILTMQASGAVSRKLGLTPDNGQDFGANFFDATVMYTQAMVGAHAANWMSGGSLQASLGQFKMGVENLKNGIPAHPPVLVSGTPDSVKGKKPAATPPADPAKSATAAGAPDPASGSAPAPTPEPVVAKAPKPKLLDRLFGENPEGWRGRLKSARDWLANLSPAKVKALQAELTELRQKQAETEQQIGEKSAALSSLEAQHHQLKAEHDTAKQEVAAKTQELAQLKQKLTETESARDGAKQTLAEKSEALAAAEKNLAELEAKKAEAEQRLIDFHEQAELSELELGVGTLEQQIESHKAELGKLRAEKRDAEVKAGALELAANELRARLDTSEKELAKRKGIEEALAESEKHVAELQTKGGEYRKVIADLERQREELRQAKDGAEGLTAQQAQKVAELEAAAKKLEKDLATRTQELAAARDSLKVRERELGELTTKFEDNEAELRTARHQAESAQRTVQTLEQVREALNRDKAQLEASLTTEQGSKAEIQTKLEETETKLTQTARDLRKANHDLGVAASIKKNLTEEADRLRGRLEEARQARDKSETELRENVRALETTVKEQKGALETVQGEAEILAQSLQSEVERAQAAEGREAELKRQHEELQAQHEKTVENLGKAERRIESLNSEIEGKKREIERQRGVITEQNQKLDGMRTKRTDLEKELREARVASAALEGELGRVRGELEAERAKEPDVVRDLNTEIELEGRIEELETEKAERESKFSALERAKAELDEKFAALEKEKAQADAALRSTQTDLEIAQGAAEGAAKDLRDFQSRAGEEEKRLKEGLDGWRKRAEETEAARLALETKARGLDGELTSAKSRLGKLEGDLAQKRAELEAARGENKVLTADIAKLEGELAESRQALQAKEGELVQVKKELGAKIEGLEQEKAAKTQEAAGLTDEVTRLRGEVEAEREKYRKLDREGREAKTASESAKATLESEKRRIQRELESKESALRRREGELSNATVRIEDLEAELKKVREEFEGQKTELERQKGEWEAKVSTQEGELSGLREDLGKARGEASGLGEELKRAQRELGEERAALKRLQGEFEELKLRSEAEAKRLREEAETLRGKEREAAAAAEAKAEEAQILESGILEVRRQQEAAEALLQGKLRAAEQKGVQEKSRADEATSELEALKARTAAEAEQLRQEAYAAKQAAAAAEARATELEASLASERARIASLEADVAAAKAEADALLAPASLRAEAEQKATEAGRKARGLEQKLAAAEQRETAASERVKALEKELLALRAESEGERERLQGEAAAHAARATAAEARAQAAEGRVQTLEAEAQAERLRAAALQADAAGKSEADATIANLREEVEGIKGMIREAENRATEAERRAAEFESALTASEESAAETSRQLDALRREKTKADAELAAAKEKLGRLEPQLTEANNKRREAETQKLGLETRIAELERQDGIKAAEILKKTGELTSAQAEVQRLWNEGQASAGDAKKKIGELERELVELRNAQEGNLEQIEIERAKVADIERTLEHMVLGETVLREEITAVKGERDRANDRARELERVLQERDTVLAQQAASLDNQQPGGFRYPTGPYFNTDPRTKPVETRVQATALIGNADGAVIGEAHICAGGEQGSMRLTFGDGSRLVGKTTIGNGNRKYQEDGIYMARYVLANGVEIKIKGWADGMGGMGDSGTGSIASSAWLQGVHARVVEAAQEGRVPTAEELYQAGHEAMLFQRARQDLNPPYSRGDKGKGAAESSAAGGVMVIVGNEAMLVTSGDASVFHARPKAEGGYEILGYSNADIIPVPNGSGDYQYNQVTKGFQQAEGRLYRISNLQAGDRLLLGSDGLWENLVGTGYKKHGSYEARSIFGFDQPSQATYRALLQALRVTQGRWDAAELIHDQLALFNIHGPGRRVNFLGEEIQLPSAADRDNILVMDYEHGDVAGVMADIPLNYSPLEPVPTAEQVRAAEAAAERSTAKGFKMTSPPSTDPNVQRPSDPQRVAANFYVKYYQSLVELYGKNADAPAVDLVGLFVRYPEMEEAFNPALLSRAEDKKQQDTLFDAAVKKIEAKRAEDPAAADAALAALDKIKKIQRPFHAADPVKAGEVLEKYRDVLTRIYGKDANMVAREYATLFLHFPGMEADLGPEALAKVEPADAVKFFKRKMMGRVHPDRTRFNEDSIATESMKVVNTLQKFYEANEEHRKLNGWGDAEAIESGRRGWRLELTKAYQGGKNGDSNLRMAHQTVSKRHFKLYANVGRWVIEDIGSTYGTYVNGGQIQKQQLKSGDRVKLGIYELVFTINPDGSANLREVAEKASATPAQPLVGAEPNGALVLNLTPGIPILVGREHIRDAQVSSPHVELIHNSRAWMIRDMGSASGTQINGVDIQSAVDPTTQRRALGTFRELKDGSLVAIGGLVFRFQEFSDRTAKLIQVDGQASPPSSAAHLRTPLAQVFRLPLMEGHTYPFQSPQHLPVAEIFWDGFDNGGGEFVLRETTNHGQVWILNGNQYEPLNGQAYAMAEGMVFGLGPKPDQSQWYVFKDGVVTALHQPARGRASTEPMRQGLSLNIPLIETPMTVGRVDLGGNNNVSSRHLELVFKHSAWWIRDVGSSNGTYLNQMNIGKGKGVAGEWKPMKLGDILNVGGVELRVSFATDGTLNLEEIVRSASTPGVSIPPVSMPFNNGASNYGPPSLRGTDLSMGWIRELKIVESDRDTGLHPEDPKSPENGKYHLVIRKKEGFLGKAGSLLGFSGKEFAVVEYLSEGRYKVTNNALKKGIRIWSDSGKDITVREGGHTDYANVGDKLTIEGQTVVLKP